MKKILILSLGMIVSSLNATDALKPAIDPLMLAVKKDDIERVKELIAAGADVNRPRMEVPVNRSVPMQSLMAIGYPIVSKSVQGKIVNAPCLLIALLNKSMRMVTLLVEHNADINALVSFEAKETEIRHIQGDCCGTHDTVSTRNIRRTEPVWKMMLDLQYCGFLLSKEIRGFLEECKTKSMK